MRQADIDYIVQIVMRQINKDFKVICETRINNTMRAYIISSIKDIICNSKEFRPILEECFSLEAKDIVNRELEKITIPLTVTQLSALTGLSKWAIYQRRHRGQLNFEKNGGRIFISLRELNSQLLSRPIRETEH